MSTCGYDRVTTLLLDGGHPGPIRCCPHQKLESWTASNRHPVADGGFRGGPARVDDLIVLSENAADRGGMDLEQAGRPRTRSLTLVTLRHLSSYCAQLSSWASPMRSPSGPRM